MIHLGFNGATLLIAWKSKIELAKKHPIIRLQWGHAFDRVEITQSSIIAWIVSLLQWGHAFDRVEMMARRCLEVLDILLQWGHAFDRVEMCASCASAA